eukprot:s4312_g7.t1
MFHGSLRWSTHPGRELGPVTLKLLHGSLHVPVLLTSVRLACKAVILHRPVELRDPQFHLFQHRLDVAQSLSC